VGIDRILCEAKVAHASLYQVFGCTGKQDPMEPILLMFDLAAKSAKGRGFRGYLYLNALNRSVRPYRQPEQRSAPA
jgi:hypothetical protein